MKRHNKSGPMPDARPPTETSSARPSFGKRLRDLLVPEGVRAEKARLEAFLAAMPGDYCGLGEDGTLAYTQGFLDHLGLTSLSSIGDVFAAIEKMDAAAFEAYFTALKQKGEEFTFTCRARHTGKKIRLTGTKGKSLDERDSFVILWLIDYSADEKEKVSLQEKIEKISEEGERFRTSLDAMPVAAWIRDSAGDLRWVNRAYTLALGLERDQIIDRQAEIPLTTNVKKSGTDHPVKKLALKALNGRRALSEKIHAVIDGDRLYLLVKETPFPEENGTFGMVQDITREEDLELEQKRHLSAHQELLEYLQTAIGIFGSDRTLEFYNSAFSRLWNLDGSWLDQKPRLQEILDRLRETRQLPEQTDFRSYKQEWLDMFTALLEPHEQMLYLPNGDVLRMLAIPHTMGGLMITFEDVTSRLELESSYNTLVAVQKETLDNLSESVIVFGGDARVKLWNPSFRKIWGLHNEDLDGGPHISRLTEKMKRFFHEDTWPEVKEDILALAILRSERSGRLERNDGTLLEYATIPLPDGGILATFFDVTDTVMVERALREKNLALEEAEKLKSDFLANVSYQLRTPLNSIMGFNEILSQEYFGDLNAKQKEYTHGMLKASTQLRDLIDNILDLASFEAGKLTLDRRKFAVRPVLEQIYELTSTWAQKEGIDLLLQGEDELGEMVADSQRIKQALLNILRNAISFTPRGGEIYLKAGAQPEMAGELREDAVYFTIEDTGVGITQEDIERIFRPFERVESKRKPGGETVRGGAGLGLTLVKNIIDLHGGEILLESAPGKGTRIEIILPRSGRGKSDTLDTVADKEILTSQQPESL